MRRSQSLAVALFLVAGCFGGTSSTITASAGADQTVSGGATVTLDASGSRDSSGLPLTYQWTQSAGTPAVTLSSPSGVKPTFTAPSVTAQATLVFQVIVSNGKTSTGASTTVTVTPGSAGGPVAVIHGPSAVHSGDSITLDASASTGTGTLSYSWAEMSGPSASFSPNGISITFTAPTVTATQQMVMVLAVTDSQNRVGTTTTTISVAPPGSALPPTATPSATPPSVNSGGSVTLNGAGTDPNAGASITGYAWAQTAGTNVTLSSASAQNPTFTAPTVTSAATLTFTLVVSDSVGQSSSPASVSVTVNPAGTNPPVAHATANPTTIASGGGNVTLSGSATDPNSGATITGYQWAQTAGPAVTINGATSASASFAAPTVTSNTTLTFSLTATDSLSLTSAPAAVSVQVTAGSSGNNIKVVFVVMMENTSATAVYGSGNAPYINNTLMAQYGYATAYDSHMHPSEPNYIIIEGGTNGFADGVTFTGDGDPSSSNSTSSTAHLAAQMNSAGVSWMSYQEGITSGTCPISTDSSNFFAPKHDPFVFFQDISGSPPSAGNSVCSAHHKAYSQFATDLGNGAVAQYNFITPNLCNDGHGASGCSNGCSSSGSSTCVSGADSWLSAEMPRIITYVNAHQGLLLIVWDEGASGSFYNQPVLVIGPNVKVGPNATTFASHGTLTKSIDEIFGLPVLSAASAQPDISSFFNAGKFP